MKEDYADRSWIHDQHDQPTTRQAVVVTLISTVALLALHFLTA